MFKKLTSSRGFTLLELMVVVTLIAIIAAIAVPNMLQARMVANETAAMGALKTIHNSQSVYKRTDWDKDGLREYARHLPDLYEFNGEKIELIKENLAKAYRFGFPVDDSDGARWVESQGYVFNTNLVYQISDTTTQQFSQDQTSRFGAHAWPAGYNLSGRNCFLIDDAGVVWQRDILDVNPDDPGENPTYNYNSVLLKPGMKAFGWLAQ